MKKSRREEGFTLIDMLFVMGLIGVLSAIAFPRLLLARQSAGAASALGSLRAISSAELTFALTCGGGFYAPTLPDLGMAPVGSPEAFLSPGMTTGTSVTRSGYTVRLEGAPFPQAPPSCNGLGAGEASQAYKAAADPVVPDVPRYFAINSNNQIWEDRSSLWAAMPEVGEPASGHVLQ
ncbi:MAG TPA: type II secretion system protein [Vicinamibacterales bacterium]